MGQFIHRENFKVLGPQEGSSSERDDPVTPLPSLNVTFLPSSGLYDREIMLLQPNPSGLMGPIQRSGQRQQDIQSRVSGEKEPFCPDDTPIITEPTVAIQSSPFSIVERTTEGQLKKLERTSSLFYGNVHIIDQLWVASIHHCHICQAFPVQLHFSIEFAPQLRKELKDEFHEDFDGMTIPFLPDQRLFVSFSKESRRNTAIECLSQRCEVDEEQDDTMQLL